MQTIFQQLDAQREALKSIQDGSRADKLQLKAAGTMLTSTNVTGEGMEGIQPQQIGYIPTPKHYHDSYLDLFPKVMVDSATVVIVNEANNDGTISAATTEGAAKNLVDVDDAVSRLTLNKYTDYIKISREMLDDIPFMSAQVDRVLRRRLKNKVCEFFFTAINAATPTYDAADLTAGTTGTTVKDCLPAIYADMQRLSEYSMNLWMLDQPDYAKLFNEAGQNYLWYGLMNPTILHNDHLTTGNIMGLHTEAFPLYIYKDINITVGMEDDDFTKNLVTIVGETRVGWSIAGNALNALYNDTITATLAAIN